MAPGSLDMSSDAHRRAKNRIRWPKALLPIKGVVVAAFYALTSIATIFLNKVLLSGFHLGPALLVFAQMAFTAVLLRWLDGQGYLKLEKVNAATLRKCWLLSAVFMSKLVLDMAALSRLEITMYGVLKSGTTLFVMVIDFVVRKKSVGERIKRSVYLITLGGMIASAGDLSFDLPGYLIALGSGMATAGYVVVVNKLGDDLGLDSFSLLMCNCIWSVPIAGGAALLRGELTDLVFKHALSLVSPTFVMSLVISGFSSFLLNWSMYMCTLVNDALTTSVVGRCKTILQGYAGLFLFHVDASLLNLTGLALNSAGVGWYTYEKWREAKGRAGGSGASTKPLLPLRGEKDEHESGFLLKPLPRISTQMDSRHGAGGGGGQQAQVSSYRVASVGSNGGTHGMGYNGEMSVGPDGVVTVATPR